MPGSGKWVNFTRGKVFKNRIAARAFAFGGWSWYATNNGSS
jgi:hypothetical protein